MTKDIVLDWDDDDADPPTTPNFRWPGARVLVADDDPDLRALVVETLAKQGYRVDDAQSAHDLVRHFESMMIDAWPADGVDLIVVDLRMPGMSGLQFVHKLRAANWETPVLLITAFAGPAVVAEAARLGVAVLSKPFSLETLTATAIALLERGHGVSPGNRVPS